MLHRAPMGAAAAPTAPAALNTTIYADMALRAWSGSSLLAEAAGEIADKTGLDLGDGDGAQNRKSGLGTLMGYVSGLGAGAAYGVLRPAFGSDLSTWKVELGVFGCRLWVRFGSVTGVPSKEVLYTMGNLPMANRLREETSEWFPNTVICHNNATSEAA